MVLTPFRRRRPIVDAHDHPPATTTVREVLAQADVRLAGLDDATRDRLAVALHARWHGQHTPEAGMEACARLAGAYEDVAAIEPLIVELMRGGA